MKRFIGLENEFELWKEFRGNPVVPVCAKELLRDIEMVFKKPYFKKTPTAYRLWTGGAMYCDGSEPEITTPPIEIKKGCIKDVVNSIIQNRNYLLECIENLTKFYKSGSLINPYKLLKEDQLTLMGYSTHYNFSSTNPVKLIDSIKYSAAIPYFLLTEQNISRGVLLREAKNRMEVGGDYIVNAKQMRVAIAYMLGTIIGIERGINLRKQPHFRNIYFKKNLMNKNTTILGENISKDRKTPIEIFDYQLKNKKGEMTLQELFEHYFKLFREDIGKFSQDEVELLEEFVKKDRFLECDSQILLEDYEIVKKQKHGKISKQPIAESFARACNEETLIPDKLFLRTKLMDWDFITYELYGFNNIMEMNIHRDKLPEFYSSLDKLIKCFNS